MSTAVLSSTSRTELRKKDAAPSPSIQDMVLDEYLPALKFLSDNVKPESLPVHFIRPEFRTEHMKTVLPRRLQQKDSRSQNLAIAREEKEAPALARVRQPTPRRPTSEIDLITNDEAFRLEDTAKVRTLLRSLEGGKLVLDSLPLLRDQSGVDFGGQDFVTVVSIFKAGVLAIEIVRNPNGMIEDSKFTADSFARVMTAAMGTEFVVAKLNSKEFQGIEEVGDILGQKFKRAQFRHIAEAEMLLMPNYVTPLVSLSVPDSVNCAVLFCEENLDAAQYEKIDLFIRIDNSDKYCSAISAAILGLNQKIEVAA